MEIKTQKIAIIGFGLIGKERLKAIHSLKNRGLLCECIGIVDPFISQPHKVEEQYQVSVEKDIAAVIDKKPDWVIICVPHHVALTIAEQFLAEKNIKLLIEKPFGCSAQEAEQLLNQQQADNQIWVGFNYRFYQGIQAVYRDIKQGFFGKIIAINMQLGHGGRPNDEKSWKLDPIKSGGGCLLDPGTHLLDLCHCFAAGTLECTTAVAWKGFWKTGIEEECHLVLHDNQTIFQIDVSIVRWRSIFRIEIHGSDGYGIVSGRNRSYGQQTYTRGKRWGWMNAASQKDSEETVVTTDGESVFTDEMEQLFFPSTSSVLLPCSGAGALDVMKLWQQCMEKMVLLS